MSQGRGRLGTTHLERSRHSKNVLADTQFPSQEQFWDKISINPEDKEYYIPQEEVGEIESNYFCRAPLSKHSERFEDGQPYCRMRSGHNTDHLGTGRCRFHGGGKEKVTEIVRGTQRRFKIEKRTKLAIKLAELDSESDEDKLNLLPELTMMRALAMTYAEDFDEIREALLEWNALETREAREQERSPRKQKLPSMDKLQGLLLDVTAIVDKIRKHQSQYAMSYRDFERLQIAQARVVQRALNSAQGKTLTLSVIGEIVENIGMKWQMLDVSK